MGNEASQPVPNPDWDTPANAPNWDDGDRYEQENHGDYRNRATVGSGGHHKQRLWNRDDNDEYFVGDSKPDSQRVYLIVDNHHSSEINHQVSLTDTAPDIFEFLNQGEDSLDYEEIVDSIPDRIVFSEGSDAVSENLEDSVSQRYDVITNPFQEEASYRPSVSQRYDVITNPFQEEENASLTSVSERYGIVSDRIKEKVMEDAPRAPVVERYNAVFERLKERDVTHRVAKTERNHTVSELRKEKVENQSRVSRYPRKHDEASTSRYSDPPASLPNRNALKSQRTQRTRKIGNPFSSSIQVELQSEDYSEGPVKGPVGKMIPTPRSEFVEDMTPSPRSEFVEDMTPPPRSEFVKFFNASFEKFVALHPHLHTIRPTIMKSLRSTKRRQLLDHITSKERDLLKQLAREKAEKDFIEKEFADALREASRVKAACQISLQSDLTKLHSETKSMQAELTWKFVDSSEVRAKRQWLIQNNHEQGMKRLGLTRRDIMKRIPHGPEGKELKDTLTYPSANNVLTPEQEKDLQQLQVENAFMISELEVLKKKLASAKAISARQQWVESILQQMDSATMEKLRMEYSKNVGLPNIGKGCGF